MVRVKSSCPGRMNRLVTGLAFLFAAIVFPGAVWAGSDAARILGEQLQGMDSFTADFSQRLIDTESIRVEPSLGRMMFKRPGKFRWIYETPYEQEIISDGNTLWVYDIDLEQVTLRPATEGLDRSPITILDEPGTISELYHVDIIEQNGEDIEIKLVPSYEGAAFQYVILIFSAHQLTAMEIFDNFDQFNSLSFHNIELNTGLDDAQFNFVPPEGIDIIHAAEQSH